MNWGYTKLFLKRLKKIDKTDTGRILSAVERILRSHITVHYLRFQVRGAGSGRSANTGSFTR